MSDTLILPRDKLSGLAIYIAKSTLGSYCISAILPLFGVVPPPSPVQIQQMALAAEMGRNLAKNGLATVNNAFEGYGLPSGIDLSKPDDAMKLGSFFATEQGFKVMQEITQNVITRPGKDVISNEQDSNVTSGNTKEKPVISEKDILGALELAKTGMKAVNTVMTVLDNTKSGGTNVKSIT